MKIACIEKFRINETYQRYENGMMNIFYFYLFYIGFYETFNIAFSSVLSKYKYTTHVIAIFVFYQLGYHRKVL